MSEFDEYQAEAVMRMSLPQLMQVNSEISEMSSDYESACEPGERRRTFQRLFEAVIGKWVAGETAADGIESWHEFCLRVERGLVQVMRGTTPAAALWSSLPRDPLERRCVRAASFRRRTRCRCPGCRATLLSADFRASGESFTLSAFNAYPHLDEDATLTYW